MSNTPEEPDDGIERSPDVRWDKVTEAAETAASVLDQSGFLNNREVGALIAKMTRAAYMTAQHVIGEEDALAELLGILKYSAVGCGYRAEITLVAVEEDED